MRQYNEARDMQQEQGARNISLLATSLSPKPPFKDGTSLADTNHIRLRPRSRLSEDITFFIISLGLSLSEIWRTFSAAW